MDIIQFVMAMYGLVTVAVVAIVLASRSEVFRPMVEGLLASVQIALNMFTNNTYRVGTMEMEAIPSRIKNHDRLSWEIEEAGNKMWAAWEADKAQTKENFSRRLNKVTAFFIAIKDAIVSGFNYVIGMITRMLDFVVNTFMSALGWFIDGCNDLGHWLNGKIEAGKAKIESIRNWWSAKKEAFVSWKSELFVQEDNADEEIIDAVYVSEFSWLQRLLGIDKICARMDRVEERLESIEADTLHLHQIRDLAELSVELQAAKISDSVEEVTVTIDEDNLAEVKEVTHGGAVTLLTIEFIENAKWADLRHLAVMYGVLKGREGHRGMPNHAEMIMLVGQAVVERGDIDRNVEEVIYEMTA